MFGRGIEIVSYVGFNQFLVLTKLSLLAIMNNADEHYDGISFRSSLKHEMKSLVIVMTIRQRNEFILSISKMNYEPNPGSLFD